MLASSRLCFVSSSSFSSLLVYNTYPLGGSVAAALIATTSAIRCAAISAKSIPTTMTQLSSCLPTKAMTHFEPRYIVHHFDPTSTVLFKKWPPFDSLMSWTTLLEIAIFWNFPTGLNSSLCASTISVMQKLPGNSWKGWPRPRRTSLASGYKF